MTKQNKQDILTDMMIELNLLGDIAFHRDDQKSMRLIETLNNRVIYLWESENKD